VTGTEGKKGLGLQALDPERTKRESKGRGIAARTLVDAQWKLAEEKETEAPPM